VPVPVIPPGVIDPASPIIVVVGPGPESGGGAVGVEAMTADLEVGVPVPVAVGTPVSVRVLTPEFAQRVLYAKKSSKFNADSVSG
jgi:hypothetical protein